MTDSPPDGFHNTVHEYRARVLIKQTHDPEAVTEFYTEWDDRLEFVQATARTLRDDGHHMEIECRERYTTVDLGGDDS